MSITERDLYEILGVDKNADANTINRAYKRLVVQWHPDKHANVSKEKLEEITKIFKEIQYAKEVLLDEEKRKIYDKYGHEGLNNNAGSDNSSNAEFNNMNDFFSNIFGNAFGGNFNINFNMNRNNNQDIVFRHAFSLEDLYNGLKINIKYNRQSKCNKCNGTGSNDGKNYSCQPCNGKGMRVHMIAPNMYSQMPCPNCRGNGKSTNYIKCNSCNGQCLVEEEYTHEITIPRGTKDQQVLEFNNIGHANLDNEERSNVKFVVSVIPNQEFNYYAKGKEEDLIMTNFTISLAESLCGFTKEIKTINGQTINISHDKPVRHGDILTLENYGMPIFGQEDKYGNLFIKITVNMPEDIANNFLVKNRLWQILTNTPFKEKYNGIMLKKQ